MDVITEQAMAQKIEPRYLTEDIYVLGQTMYKDGPQGPKPLTANNWHHHLKDYGWQKPPMPWIKALNTRRREIDQPETKQPRLKNSPYGVLDCGGDGDCFFHCIAHALSERDDVSYGSDDIREMVCETIQDEDFERMIEFYRIMQDADDFEEDWDPYEVRTSDDFKDILREGGHTYWGDYQLVTHMMDTLLLNFVILTHEESTDDISVYNMLQDHKEAYDTIVLLYENHCHFKLIGYFTGTQMISHFRGRDLPDEFQGTIALSMIP